MKIQRLSEFTSFSGINWEELSPEEQAKAYAQAKAAFTAEDLQRYTELDEGVSLDQVLAELEEMEKEAGQGKQ